jgi:hypothetical protein
MTALRAMKTAIRKNLNFLILGMQKSMAQIQGFASSILGK